jgi:hypothetical protein
VWSEWIIAETWRVLSWQWLVRAGRTDHVEWRALTQAANTMLAHLIPVMTLVSLRGYNSQAPWPTLKDRNDSPIWQTAIVANAQFVISQNVADFPPLIQGRHVYAGIEYLTAIEYIEAILQVDAAELLGAALPAGAAIRSQRNST